jgi:hypothetical protein
MTMEKLQKWAHIAEITGAVAVVLSLLYVGYQIKENTDAQLSATENNLFNLGVALDEWYMDPGFVEVVARANSDFSSLSDVERLRFARHVGMSLNLWTYAWKSYTRGQIDQGEWDAWNNWFVEEMDNPAWRTIYEDKRDGYHVGFQAHVDASISDR